MREGLLAPSTDYASKPLSNELKRKANIKPRFIAHERPKWPL